MVSALNIKQSYIENPIALETLSLNPALAQLPEHVLEEVACYCNFRSFRSKEYIFHEGDIAYSCYVVVSGRVSILKGSNNGRELIYALLPSSQAFALIPALEKRAYPVSAKADGATELLCLHHKDLKNLAEKYPEIRTAALSIVSNRMKHALEFSRALAHDSVKVRIASVLLSLLPPMNNKTTCSIVLQRKELADLCGTSIESASRMGKELEKCNILDLSKHGVITVIDHRALTQVAQNPRAKEV